MKFSLLICVAICLFGCSNVLPSKHKIVKDQKICDSIYILPAQFDMLVYDKKENNYKSKSDVADKYDSISSSLSLGFLSDYFKVSPLLINQAQQDSITNRLARIRSLSFEKRLTNIFIDTKDLDFKRKGVAFFIMSKWVYKRDFRVHGPDGPGCQMDTNLFVFDVSSGEIIYYDYTFRSSRYNPEYSIEKIYRDIIKISHEANIKEINSEVKKTLTPGLKLFAKNYKCN